MKKGKTGTTAYNRPHRQVIHYSAKGYDEYRADLIRRLEKKGFVLREGDFVNAFIDLTAYLGEVLMTYQNAYAQEIYLETAQLRESLFSLAAMVDYRVDPGSAATGTLMVMAKPDKSGLLLKGTLVSGKEEGAKKAVFFETDADLNVDAKFNDFTLAHSERFNEIAIGYDLLIKEKLIVRPGQYIYFKSISSESNLFAQVQSSKIDEKDKTTTVSWSNSSEFKYISPASTEIWTNLKAGSGDWGLINNEARGLLKLVSGANVWLDNKHENIAAGSPIVLRYDSSEKYGRVTGLSFDTLSIKAGVSTRISKGYSTSTTVPDDLETDEIVVDNYIVSATGGDKKFFVIQKVLKESREVSKLTVSWLNGNPDNYNNGVDPTERSSKHIIFIGIQTQLKVKTESKNTDSISGDTLTLDGDFSVLEKYRTLILHEVIDGKKTVEEANVYEVTLKGKKSTIKFKNAISNKFTRHGVKIWGNVVKVTQGKTVANTILGSGRGDESYQTLELPQSPLTYERRGREGIKGAIDIKVSALSYQQKDDFLYSGPEDRHYMIETGFDGKSRVIFGDGFNGSRLPTGRDNIIATFRIGQGASGNVSSGVLKKPVSKPSFLKELLNPEKTAGGSDPDTEEQLREKIPTEHLTFNRAVSLQDYADLALLYPGVGKARAGWRWCNNKKYVVLSVAGEKGENVSSILKDLRDYLDARRDVNQPLIVKEVDTVLIKLSVNVIAASGYDKEKVQDKIYKALGTGVNDDGTPQFFNLDRLKIGMSIHKKDIYRVVENIPGVDIITNLEITRSSSKDNSSNSTSSFCSEKGHFKPSFCSEDVWINNRELAKLDVATLDIAVNPSSTNKLCKRSGG